MPNREVTFNCVSCNIQHSFLVPGDNPLAVWRCSGCDGMIFEKPAQDHLFERNTTHTREDH